MPLRDYLVGRRLFSAGGHSFLVRSPTVATAETILQEFPGEVAALRAVYEPSQEAEFLASAAHVLASTSRGRMLTVLMTCVEEVGPASSNPDRWPVPELAVEVARMVDLGRVIGVFGGQKDGNESESGVDRSICATAAYFGVSPVTVLEWPFFAFISAQAAIREASASPADSAPVSADVFNAMGRGEL